MKTLENIEIILIGDQKSGGFSRERGNLGVDQPSRRIEGRRANGGFIRLRSEEAEKGPPVVEQNPSRQKTRPISVYADDPWTERSRTEDDAAGRQRLAVHFIAESESARRSSHAVDRESVARHGDRGIGNRWRKIRRRNGKGLVYQTRDRADLLNRSRRGVKQQKRCRRYDQGIAVRAERHP